MINNILDKIKRKVKNKNIRIIYTDPNDERILLAADKVLKQKIGVPILVGKENEIKNSLKKLRIKSDLIIVDPEKTSLFPKYVFFFVFVGVYFHSFSNQNAF